MGEHGDIAFHSVKNSVPAMFAKKQFGSKARNIDRNPTRKRHRKATCAARVDETVSATIAVPKSRKIYQKSTKIGPWGVLWTRARYPREGFGALGGPGPGAIIKDIGKTDEQRTVRII